MKTTWTLFDYKEYKKNGTIPEENTNIVPKHQKEKIISLRQAEDTSEANKELFSLLRFKEENNEVIFINGNVPSSKNSKDIFSIYTGLSQCCNRAYDKKTKICSKCHKKTKSGKRPILTDSKTVKKYKKEYEQEWIDNTIRYHNIIKDHKLPLWIGLYFIRKSAHRFDGNNASQIITDLMTKYGWHDDDDMDNMTALPIGYHKDKDNPGVYIFVLKNNIKTDILNYI